MASRKKVYQAGLRRGASISPRQAYRKGYRSGAARTDAVWTKKAALQSHYYYQMGKNSR